MAQLPKAKPLCGGVGGVPAVSSSPAQSTIPTSQAVRRTRAAWTEESDRPRFQTQRDMTTSRVAVRLVETLIINNDSCYFLLCSS